MLTIKTKVPLPAKYRLRCCAILCTTLLSAIPNAARIFYIAQAFQKHASIDEVYELTKIDRWFLRNIAEIVAETECLKTKTFLRAKKFGFSDRQLAIAQHASEKEIRSRRKAEGVAPTYRLVDTCAAEFEAYTPYYYSTYDRGDDEVKASEDLVNMGVDEADEELRELDELDEEEEESEEEE